MSAVSRLVAVTGANTGIGFEIVRQLASKPGYRVVRGLHTVCVVSSEQRALRSLLGRAFVELPRCWSDRDPLAALTNSSFAAGMKEKAEKRLRRCAVKGLPRSWCVATSLRPMGKLAHFRTSNVCCHSRNRRGPQQLP